MSKLAPAPTRPTLARRVLVGVVLWVAFFLAALTPVAILLTGLALAWPELGTMPTIVAMTACVTSFVHFEWRRRFDPAAEHLRSTKNCDR